MEKVDEPLLLVAGGREGQGAADNLADAAARTNHVVSFQQGILHGHRASAPFAVVAVEFHIPVCPLNVTAVLPPREFLAF